MRQMQSCAEGMAIAFSFACLLCQPILASLVIHSFDPRDSLIEDPVVRGHCQRKNGSMQMKRAIVLKQQ